MAQHHPAFLTSFAADNSAGTAAWSNPSNAAASDGSYATVEFSAAAGEESQWLVCTGPAFRRAFQSGETPTGVTVVIEARDAAGDTYTGSAGLVLVEARLVVGGVIQSGASNLATGQQVGDSANPERHQIVLGGPTEPWGATLAEGDMDSGLGVALRFECLDATARTLQVDSVRLIAWGTKASACVAEVVGGSTGEAPLPVLFHCRNSSWASPHPHEIDFRHAITGPAGWSKRTVSDPRPGDAVVNGQTLYLGNTLAGLQPHAWGKLVGFIADAPGTYTDTATMFERAGAVNTLTASAPTSVTVTASTRTRYFVHSGGDDSTGDGSSGSPWATLKGAIDNLEALMVTEGYDIVFAEGDTVEYTQRTVIDGHSNFAIYTDGTTGSLATMAQAASVSFLELQNCTDARVYRLIGAGEPGTYTRGYFVTGFANSRCGFWDNQVDGYLSFAEWSSSGTESRGHVYQENVVTGFTRYVVYIDAGRDFACVGNDSNTEVAAVGEGHYRFQGHAGQASLGDLATSGQGCWMMGNRTRSTTSHTGFRHGWSEYDAIFNSFEPVTTFNLSHNQNTTNNDLEINGRFTANYIAALGWGYASSYVHLGSNVIEFTGAASVAGAGVSDRYDFELNTLLFNRPSIGSESAVATQLTTTEHVCRAMAWRGNLWSSDQDLSAWTGSWWRNGITTPTTRAFNGQWASNVYAQRAAWREENTAYSTAANWNARADVDGEVVVASLYAASRPLTADDFAPDEDSFPPVRNVDPADVAGTFVNYQGWLRDPAASDWLAGGWGDEEAPAQAAAPARSRASMAIGIGIGM